MDGFQYPGTGARQASRGRILLVEDNPDAVVFLTYVLAGRGRFEVAHTADPAAALALAAASAPDLAPDLVVTDLDLPVMSGLELVAALRERVARLPVILVTSRSRDAWPEPPPGDCEPDAVLIKPVLPDDLLAVVRKLIGGEPG